MWSDSSGRTPVSWVPLCLVLCCQIQAVALLCPGFLSCFFRFAVALLCPGCFSCFLGFMWSYSSGRTPVTWVLSCFFRLMWSDCVAPSFTFSWLVLGPPSQIRPATRLPQLGPENLDQFFSQGVTVKATQKNPTRSLPLPSQPKRVNLGSKEKSFGSLKLSVKTFWDPNHIRGVLGPEACKCLSF